jgi:hypothetical protein
MYKPGRPKRIEPDEKKESDQSKTKLQSAKAAKPRPNAATGGKNSL